jgi:hypothetical protein
MCIAFAASAQNIKPGLWEITNKMGAGAGGGEMAQAMGEMQKQMASMPPEQRKMMEDMMARQGIKLGSAGAGGVTVKVCMTKEMVERNEFPAQKGDCKTTQQQRTGNTMKMAFTCTNPPSSGDGQITFMGSEAYNMKMNVNTTVRGQAENMTVEGAGKWQGADCGDIKPMGSARK